VKTEGGRVPPADESDAEEMYKERIPTGTSTPDKKKGGKKKKGEEAPVEEDFPDAPAAPKEEAPAAPAPEEAPAAPAPEEAPAAPAPEEAPKQ
jgi:2-oxoglutarate dehydrogenase E2 component (dihydrolipoamide succinyltransferase)